MIDINGAIICTYISCCSILDPANGAGCICARSSLAAYFCTCRLLCSGNRREFSWKSTHKDWVYPYAVELCCPHHPRRNVYCQISVHPCVGKRYTHNLYRSLYLELLLGQPHTFNPADPSQLVMSLDLPTFTTDFEPLSLANLPSFRKRSPTILSSVRFWHAEAVRDRAIDYWISRNTRTSLSLLLPSPALSPPPSSHV